MNVTFHEAAGRTVSLIHSRSLWIVSFVMGLPPARAMIVFRG